MEIISTLTLAIAASYIIWSCISLLQNYQKARRSGFPIFVCPANTNNLLWILFSVTLRPVLSFYLPKAVYDRIQPAIYGWEFLARYTVFDRLGPTFILVTPGKNELYVAEPEIAHSILMRRNDFAHLPLADRIIGIFGPNLITAEGDEWSRLRKVIAPLLNERISRSVWDESCQQAQEMLQHFTSRRKDSGAHDEQSADLGETRATIEGVRSIAINVIGSVAYGTPRSWHHRDAIAQEGFRLSYMDAILAIVENLVPATFVPITILTSPVMPRSIQRIGFAVKEFPVHAKKLLDDERNTSPASGQAKNLMSTLVKVSDAERHATTASSKGSYLSEHELTGNMFQFTIAGFDTTANTMCYAITLLAANPVWQIWIRDEIDQVVLHGQDGGYENLYPQLKRCLALMRTSFIPWSAGPRNCPGQKMAEVEFVAVMYTIFGKWKVEPALGKGESELEARQILEALMADSQPRVTLQMNRPREVKLRWQER
ncbi:hypothetical protein OEA41_007249 [Lepraria neglecta]|uniref:Cytochrome P450 n=1 Tax=Lepraria neglecta TaxID=209136 RepID=A0AAD9ZCG3_9LECA|nr:hypothetical protein OEA41_007249 [Lepraria neglecta]